MRGRILNENSCAILPLPLIHRLKHPNAHRPARPKPSRALLPPRYRAHQHPCGKRSNGYDMARMFESFAMPFVVLIVVVLIILWLIDQV
jgi:hypothetical protein